MTDISVDVQFVAENVPDPTTLSNAQLINIGQRVAQRAWAAAQNALAPVVTDGPGSYAFGSETVAVFHKDPSRDAKDLWVYAVVPLSDDPQADAQKALEILAETYNAKPANFTPQRQFSWGPFVYEAVRKAKP